MANDAEPHAVLYEPSHPAQGICSITINRPQKRNAVDTATALKLYDAFVRFEDDASQKVAILSGADGTFCAGADLVALANSSSSSSTFPSSTNNITAPASTTTKEIATLNGAPNMQSLVISTPTSPSSSASSASGTAQAQQRQQQQQHDAPRRQPGPMGPSRLMPSKPVIAAISGYAVAGGLELALLCDLRVVDERAVLGVFCRRFGVPLIDGGTVRLPAIVGLGRALDLILTGRPVDAREALHIGLATRVASHGQAFADAVALATDLMAFPQQCMLADRSSAYSGVYNDSGSQGGGFMDKLRAEFDRGVKVITTESVAGATRFKAGQGRGGAKL